jgi:hypothetical protein
MRLPTAVRRRLLDFAMHIMTSRPADFIVGESDNPYLRRWYVLPRNRWFNIYAHEFLRSDDDVALHDHMYVNLSLVLYGGYVEQLEDRMIFRPQGSVIARLPKTPHRVILLPIKAAWPVLTYPAAVVPDSVEAAKNGAKLRSAISLFICGPRVREWGFRCASGWRPWHEVVESHPGGNRQSGRKC